jgi:hypothetical protein
VYGPMPDDHEGRDEDIGPDGYPGCMDPGCHEPAE